MFFFFFNVGTPFSGIPLMPLFFQIHFSIFSYIQLMLDGAPHEVDCSKPPSLPLSPPSLDTTALLDETGRVDSFSSFTRRTYGAFLRSNELASALHASFFLEKDRLHLHLRFS